MENQGTLWETPLPQILHSLFATKTTGALVVQKGELKKTLYFSDGAPIYIESSQMEDTFGFYLVREGLLSETERQKFLLKSLSAAKDLSVILIEEGRLTPAELFEHLRKNFTQNILEIFRWSEGDFQIVEGRKVPNQVLSIKLNAGRVILKGVEGFLPMPVVKKQFKLQTDDVFSLTGSDPYRLWEFQLTDDEDRLVGLIRKKMAIKEILKQERMERDPVHRMLYALSTMRAIEPPGGEGAKAAAAVNQLQHLAELATGQIPEPIAPEPTVDQVTRDHLLEKSLRFRSQNLFEILEIPSAAGDEEIRRAYLLFVRRYGLVGKTTDQPSDLVEKSDELLCLGAQAFAILSDPQKRHDYLKEINGSAPEQEADASFRAGFRFLREKRFGPAYEMFQLAYDLDPKKPIYLAFVGFSDFLISPASNFQRGLQLVDTALASEPASESITLIKARMLGQHGDVAAAKQCLQIALEKNPSNAAYLDELNKLPRH